MCMENKEKTDEFIEEKGVECDKCYLVRNDYSLYEDIGEWKKEYKEFLKEYEKFLCDKKDDEIKDNWGNGIDPYRDPDSNCFEFYKDLAAFLNEQEKKYIKQEKLYHYEAWGKPFGIKVTDNKGKLQFYLKSDQFGFSAPKDNKYPYDSYLQKSSYSETSKENVAKWLYKTRSLGGSFLWPMEPDGKGGYQENPQYNNTRGGTKHSAGNPKYYIEDRVDLTLLEIKQVMDYIGSDHPELQGNILWNCCLPETNMVRWLKHFKTFETYVKFFKLDIFVDKDYIPFDIVKANEDSIETTIYTGLNRPRSIWKSKTEEMDDVELKDMFNYLSEKIVQRSEAMEEIVRQEVENEKN